MFWLKDCYYFASHNVFVVEGFSAVLTDGQPLPAFNEGVEWGSSCHHPAEEGERRRRRQLQTEQEVARELVGYDALKWDEGGEGARDAGQVTSHLYPSRKCKEGGCITLKGEPVVSQSASNQLIQHDIISPA